MKNFTQIRCLGLFLMMISMMNCFAQSGLEVITVDHLGTPRFFTRLDSAVNFAQNDDVIYLSSGVFTLSDTLAVSKRIKLYGVGHYADSTTATGGITKIIGSLRFASASDGSFFSGIYLTGNLITLSGVTKMSIIYSSIESISVFDPNGPLGSNVIYISDCVIRTAIDGKLVARRIQCKRSHVNNISNVEGGSYDHCLINYLCHVNNTSFSNNYCYANALTTVNYNNCTLGYFINLLQNSQAASHNNSFINNFFTNSMVTSWTLPDALGNTGSGNIFFNTSWSATFVNASSSFSYSSDYHIKATSVAKNAATDGTDIGVYGTMEPYKNGAVPDNPHIYFKQITTNNNTLQLNIKVSAQDR
ncbi:MAG: hypothetical protein NTU44_08915 [Bacteroidetes bacterium]|nr:hypothetical protein [Bacteroidota bacterium]